MFSEVPKNYDEIYLNLSRRGARVLALGIRDIGSMSNQDLRDLKREAVECGLRFESSSKDFLFYPNSNRKDSQISILQFRIELDHQTQLHFVNI